MFQNDTQSVNGRHPSSRNALQHFSAELLRKKNPEAQTMREKPLVLPSTHALATNSDFKTPAILYRNSAECRPYHHALHAFEGAQFGNDFTCESANFDHWFNAEAYFCAAAFSGRDNGYSQILSLIEMLFVTETSALEFLCGTRKEEELMPFNKDSGSAPVVYFSSLVAENFAQLIPLYKILLKDIDAYKAKYKLTPAWGFSIGATEHGIRYLTNCGFYETETNKNFLDKYAIVKIDEQSARSKIWTSIFRTPTPINSDHWLKDIRTLDSVSQKRFRSNKPMHEEAIMTAFSL